MNLLKKVLTARKIHESEFGTVLFWLGITPLALSNRLINVLLHLSKVDDYMESDDGLV
jgi:hypothetical protein